MSSVTAKELAEMLGLSQAAVSLALRGKPGVSEQTRRRVLEKAKEMGLVRETLPQLQKQSPGKRIRFLIFVNHLVSIAENTTFSSFLLKGAADTAAELGHTVSLFYLNADNPLTYQLSSLLEETDGVLLLGTDLTEESRREISAVFEKRPELPVVVLDSVEQIFGADYVCNDNYAGARSAVEYLISRGCRRIGYLRSSFRNRNFEDRAAGVRGALSAAGLRLACEVETAVSFDDAYLSMLRFLQSAKTLPDGLFAENDVVAAAAIRACNACGVKVPGQISVIGFDDIPICELCSPNLTTVHSHKERLGQIAVSILHMRFNHTPVEETRGSMKIFLSTSLRVRDSVI